MTYTPIDRGSADWDVPVNAAFTSQDTRITTNETSISTINGTLTTHTNQLTTIESEIDTLQGETDSLDWQPGDHSLIGWTQDPASAAGSATSVSGTIYWVKIPVRRAATITNVIITISAVGVTLTAGQNLVGLYDASGTKLGESADQTTSWTSGGIGAKVIPLLTPVAVSAGFFYAAMMSNGATPANFMRGNSQSSSAMNLGSTFRFVNTTSNTSLPASFTPGSANTDNNARWAALS